MKLSSRCIVEKYLQREETKRALAEYRGSLQHALDMFNVRPCPARRMHRMGTEIRRWLHVQTSVHVLIVKQQKAAEHQQRTDTAAIVDSIHAALHQHTAAIIYFIWSLGLAQRRDDDSDGEAWAANASATFTGDSVGSASART